MWIADLTRGLDRRKAPITFDPHVFDRRDCRSLNLARIEETIRTGSIVERTCEEPDKLCFRRHFGKENVTYVVITRFHHKFIEVKTAWKRKGR